MKRELLIAGGFVVVWLMAIWLHAATFTTGYNFTPNEQVTDVKLENLVNNATITRTSADDTDNSTLEINSNKYRVKDSGITSTKILDYTILTTDIATGAVTSANILDHTITGDDIATNTITSINLATNAVESWHLSTTFDTLVQSISVSTGEVMTTTADFAGGDLIPQLTNGLEILSVTISPQFTNSLLRVTAMACAKNSVANNIIVALFRDSTTNAFQAGWAGEEAHRYPFPLVCEVTSDATNSTTFKLHVGPEGSGTVTINGDAGARKLGGVLKSWLRVEEVIQ